MGKARMFIFLAFGLGFIFPSCQDDGGGKLLRSEGLWIKDEENRVVILRGINAGADSKIPPFLPFSSEDSAEQISGWGMNVVRYLVTWEGLEPEPGVYSEEYLDLVAEAVNWLTQRDIFVFIDFHQDLFCVVG